MSFEDEIKKANINRKYIIGENLGLDPLEKGRKGGGAPIGTIKEMGGRSYIKAADGTWKYHGKGTGAKAQAHASGVKPSEEQPPQHSSNFIQDNPELVDRMVHHELMKKHYKNLQKQKAPGAARMVEYHMGERDKAHNELSKKHKELLVREIGYTDDIKNKRYDDQSPKERKIVTEFNTKDSAAWFQHLEPHFNKLVREKIKEHGGKDDLSSYAAKHDESAGKQDYADRTKVKSTILSSAKKIFKEHGFWNFTQGGNGDHYYKHGDKTIQTTLNPGEEYNGKSRGEKVAGLNKVVEQLKKLPNVTDVKINVMKDGAYLDIKF